MLCGLKHLNYHARSPPALEELCPHFCPQQPEKCLLIKVTWFSWLLHFLLSPIAVRRSHSSSFVTLEPRLPFPDSRIHLHPLQRSIGVFLIFLALALAFLWEFLKRSGDKTQTLPSQFSCPHKEDPRNSHSSLWVLLKHNNEILHPNCFWRNRNCVDLIQLHFI